MSHALAARAQPPSDPSSGRSSSQARSSTRLRLLWRLTIQDISLFLVVVIAIPDKSTMVSEYANEVVLMFDSRCPGATVDETVLNSG